MNLGRSPRLDTDDIDVVSTDIFDTILLRDLSCEHRRFATVAVEGSARLKAIGLKVDPEILLQGRQQMQLAAYRAVDISDPPGDVKLHHIIDLLTRALKLPSMAADILIESEIAVDARSLKPNLRLLKTLTRLAAAGRRIIAVSDTYYSESTLSAMFRTIIGLHPIARIYSSSDLYATKKSGHLYRRVLTDEGVTAGRVLHLGDDWRSDVFKADGAGLRACWTPRPASVRLQRKIDALRWKLRPEFAL